MYEDICPFTVFGSFNKGITNANRIALLEQFAKQFSIKAAVPTEFDGIPVVMNLSAWFFAYKENRGEHDIDNLWNYLKKPLPTPMKRPQIIKMLLSLPMTRYRSRR